MGMNFYLHLKTNYDSVTEGLEVQEYNDCVDILENGFVWHRKYYANKEDLNKEYYMNLHIGKSSFGWHFLLCVYNCLGITCLNDWIKLFDKHEIYDEENKLVSKEEMLDRITNRHKPGWTPETAEKLEAEELKADQKFRLENSLRSRIYASTYEEFLNMNNAERGKNGLWQHKSLDRRPITHTSGTYDLTYEWNFS